MIHDHERARLIALLSILVHACSRAPSVEASRSSTDSAAERAGKPLGSATAAALQVVDPERPAHDSSRMPQLNAAIVRRSPTGVVNYIDRQAAPAERPRRRVILISIDGLAPYVQRHAKTPTLDRLSREGVAFTNALTVTPSITLTSHASMLSGYPPEQHRVFWNGYNATRAFTGRTVFTHCREHELRCAMFAAKEKFVHFAELEAGVQHYEHRVGAADLLAVARSYLTESDAAFVFIHLAEVDDAGHAHGWDSPEQITAIEQIDSDIREFLVPLAQPGTRPFSLIITSDHGGHGLEHDDNIPENVQILWLGYGDGLQRLGIVPNTTPISTMDTAATVLALLDIESDEKLVGRTIALQHDVTRAASANGRTHR